MPMTVPSSVTIGSRRTPRSRIMRWDWNIEVTPDDPTHVESDNGQWRLRSGTRSGPAKPPYVPTPGKTRPRNLGRNPKRKKQLRNPENERMFNPPWLHKFRAWSGKTRPEHEPLVREMYERLGAQLDLFKHWED